MRVLAFLARWRLWIAAALVLACQPAWAEKRVALVLGNAAYQSVPPLARPVDEAALVADTLRRAAFDVVDFRQNLTALETQGVLREFADISTAADIAVVYYAGHGVDMDGVNYLIPVDARLERDNDVSDQAFTMDNILASIASAGKLRLVILDACRDNPFIDRMKRTTARSIGRGLAKIDPTGPNTLIAYSAKAGTTAQESNGRDSSYAMALARHLTAPGLDIRGALGLVREDVVQNTNHRQEPFVYGALSGNDVPLAPSAR